MCNYCGLAGLVASLYFSGQAMAWSVRVLAICCVLHCSLLWRSHACLSFVLFPYSAVCLGTNRSPVSVLANAGDQEEIAAALKPLPPEAPAASRRAVLEPASSRAGSNTNDGAGTSGGAAEAAAQPMDTDVPAAGTAEASSSHAQQGLAGEAGQAAAGDAAGGAAVEEPAAAAVDGMDVDEQPAEPAAAVAPAEAAAGAGAEPAAAAAGEAQPAAAAGAEPAAAAGGGVEPAAAAAPAAAPGAPAAAAPTTPAAAAAAQQQQERAREREEQRQEDARLSAIAKRALAESLEAVAKRQDNDADLEVRGACCGRFCCGKPCHLRHSAVFAWNIELHILFARACVGGSQVRLTGVAAIVACVACTQTFLPAALTAASRMLEPLLTNAETSRQFVERGGTDVLLKVYQLPKLTVSAAGFAAGCVLVCAMPYLARHQCVPR